MKKILFAIIVLSFLIISCTNDNETLFSGVYIAQSGGNTISLYSDSLINDFITDIHKMPNAFAYDGELLYCVSSQDAYIDVIDPKTGSMVNSIALPAGSNPFDIIEENGVLYVSLFGSKQVCAVRNDTILHISDTLNSSPEGLSYYGGKIFVCCTGYTPDTLYGHYEEGEIAILNEDMTMDTIIQIGEGTNPQDIMFLGSNAYILCTGNYFDVSASLKYINASEDDYPYATWAENIAGSPSVMAYYQGTFFVGGYGMPVYKLQMGTITDTLSISYASVMKVWNDSLLYIGSGYWNADTYDSLFIYNLKTQEKQSISLLPMVGPSAIEIIE